MKNKFGFDEAFNYKEEQDYDACLKRLVLILLHEKTNGYPFEVQINFNLKEMDKDNSSLAYLSAILSTITDPKFWIGKRTSKA